MNEEEQIILPEGFRRVEYLQSTGTQYIDTEYIPDNETGYWADAININSKNSYILGLNNTNDWNSNQRIYLRTVTTLLVGWMTYNTINSTNYSGFRVVGRMNYLNDRTAHYFVDNKEYSGTLDDLNFTPVHSIYIFGINFGGTIDTAGAAYRLYGVKISQGSEVVRHFIPCVDEDEVGCLYDIIEKKVYYNAGSGDFKYPKDWEDEEDETLPEGFKRLKYISFTKQQWIKTGVYVSNTLGAKVKYSRTLDYSATDDTKHCYILCARSQTAGNGENNTWGIPLTSAATENHPFRCSFGTSYQNDNIRSELGKVYEVEHNYLNSSKSSVNNELLAEYNRSLFISDDYCKNELILGSFVNDELFPYNAYNHYGRLYYCTITDGEEIIRNYIPCLDSSGEPCLYETVNGTVHYNEYNANGFEVEYITERKINNYYELPAGFKRCLYLQSDGTQWIDTGVIPDSETGLYFKALQLSYGNFIPFGVSKSGSEIYPPRFSDKDLYYRWGSSAVKLLTWDKAGDLFFVSSINHYNSKLAFFNSDDTDISLTISQSGTYTLPIWLFSYNLSGFYSATYGKWIGRIFRAQITQGTYLMRDYVPCLDADGRPCMYDLITQEAYYNQSGGTEFAYCVEHQLPSDFIKLKYLESNSNLQHIKTGYIPTNNTGMYVDAYNTVVDDVVVMGIQNTTSGNDRMWIGGVMKATYGARYGWGTVVTPGGTGDVRFEASLNWLNDKKSIITCPAFAQRVNALSDLTFTPNQDIYIFGWNRQGSLNHWKGRIYRAKISEGSEIVRDFVPAYDSRRDKPCMYDLINNVAYYNDGEGEFLTNRDFEGDYLECGVLSCIGNRLGGEYDPINEKLPSGYTRVEFLRGTGQQYIKTEIYPDGETGFEIEYFIKSLVYNMNLFGAREAWLNNQYQLLASPEYIQFRYAKSNQFFHCNETPEYNTSTFASFLNNKVVIGSKKGVVSRRVFECPSPLYVFGGSQMGEINENCFRGGIYYFNLYESGDLILKFIPTIDPSGVPCMYDIVTDRPFYNNGTGQFIVGMKTLSQAISLRLPEIGGTLQLSLPTNDNIEYYEEKIRANNPSWNFTFSYH